LQLIWPWQDRNRRFSALKAGAFALMLVPATRLIYQLDTGEFGFYPLSLGGPVYCHRHRPSSAGPRSSTCGA
jgi:hypothetical protein